MQTLDQRALFAAVLAHPEEDTPRLMLADALEETDPARAEFIRIQCELAGIRASGVRLDHSPYRPVVHSLRARESALLATHRERWLRIECPKCGGTGDSRGVNLSHTFERCKTCTGTGDMGGLTWAIVPDLLPSGGIYKWNPPEVEFRRGFPHVVRCARLVDAVGGGCLNCGANRPGANSYNVCSKCGMTVGVGAAATPWLAAVAAHHPTVEQVIPGDREPATNVLPDRAFFWCREYSGIPLQPHHLPSAVFDLLEGGNHHRVLDAITMSYSTRELAFAALGRAIIAFARKESTA